MSFTRTLAVALSAAVVALMAPSFAAAQDAAPAEKKPNILVIFGDDVGMWNISFGV